MSSWMLYVMIVSLLMGFARSLDFSFMLSAHLLQSLLFKLQYSDLFCLLSGDTSLLGQRPF